MSKDYTMIYNIFDKNHELQILLNKVSIYADTTGTLNNSLQSMLGKIARYESKTITEIAGIYSIDLKNTVKYVSELEKRGYLVKQKKGKNKHLFLTEKGKLINELLSNEKAKMMDVILDNLSKNEIEAMDGSLSKLLNGIREYEKKIKKNEIHA